jgi:succinyl-CoA synthetase beta subunit
MNLHEYQAKTLLKNNNVRVLAGIPVLEVTDIDNAIDSIQTPVMVVKSQIHAGGRGAGKFLDSGDDKGGVRVCFSKEEAKENAKKMLGKTLVTKQTGPDGKIVNRLYVEEGCDIKKEYYLSTIFQSFKMKDVHLAHELMESSSHIGKILIDMKGE